jgi:nucleotide-binding universal stress UspA family protein
MPRSSGAETPRRLARDVLPCRSAEAHSAPALEGVSPVLTFSRIVVATDFEAAADAAVTCACAIARAFSATLYIVHVVQDLSAAMPPVSGLTLGNERAQAEMQMAAERRLETVARRNCDGIRTTTMVLTAQGPAQAVLDYGRGVGADLIVAGTHGRSAISGFFMGSVAQKIVRTAPCPVLTVHAPVAEAAA